jgi:hypothetical protein
MAFLIITESIENTIHSLRSDRDLCKKVFKQTGDHKYEAKAKDYDDKLQAAIRYQKIEERRTEYQRIKHLRHRNLGMYIHHCTKICKGMKGVYFDKDRLLFRVQITRRGKRIYLGQFDTPDDALEILKTHM